MKDKNNEIPEVVIPKGYAVDEILDMGEDFGDEEPLVAEEVKIRFE